MGAVIRVDRGWEEVAHFTSPQEEAVTVRRAVGLADWSSIPKFDLQGRDLNSPPALGEQVHSWRLRPGRYLVTCRPPDRDLVEGELNRYVAAAGASSNRAYLTDVTSGYAALLLAGPLSPEVLRKLVDLDVSDAAFPNLTCVQTGVHDTYSILLRRDTQSLKAYLILVNREYGEWLWETVLDAGAECGIQPFGSAAHELLTNTCIW
jgi:heterotetrameric sarcosine oxidase gamma subunit